MLYHEDYPDENCFLDPQKRAALLVGTLLGGSSHGS